jgi:hypothetical protein
MAKTYVQLTRDNYEQYKPLIQRQMARQGGKIQAFTGPNAMMNILKSQKTREVSPGRHEFVNPVSFRLSPEAYARLRAGSKPAPKAAGAYPMDSRAQMVSILKSAGVGGNDRDAMVGILKRAVAKQQAKRAGYPEPKGRGKSMMRSPKGKGKRVPHKGRQPVTSDYAEKDASALIDTLRKSGGDLSMLGFHLGVQQAHVKSAAPFLAALPWLAGAAGGALGLYGAHKGLQGAYGQGGSLAGESGGHGGRFSGKYYDPNKDPMMQKAMRTGMGFGQMRNRWNMMSNMMGGGGMMGGPGGFGGGYGGGYGGGMSPGMQRPSMGMYR